MLLTRREQRVKGGTLSDTIVTPSHGARRTASDRRETIIAAARTLFARHGFHGTGMAQIARESQVLVGQIYRDFAGKEALIDAIVERDINDVLDDPEIAGAIAARAPDQLNRWVRRFISRRLDDETLSVLTAILSEAMRNPRIASIVAAAHERLHARLVSAAMVWAPEPEKDTERRELVDLILAAAGSIQHRQFFGQQPQAHVTAKMIDLVEREIRHLAHANDGAQDPAGSFAR